MSLYFLSIKTLHQPLRTANVISGFNIKPLMTLVVFQTKVIEKILNNQSHVDNIMVINFIIDAKWELIFVITILREIVRKSKYVL